MANTNPICRAAGCLNSAEHGWDLCHSHRSRSGWPDLHQRGRAYELMRDGLSLKSAAFAVGCFASCLDQALWADLGRYRPMF